MSARQMGGRSQIEQLKREKAEIGKSAGGLHLEQKPEFLEILQ